MPTSQCMTCHMHPGTNMVTTYQGLMWWDNETDGDKMYPAVPFQRSDAAAGGDREAESRRERRSAACGAIPNSCSKTGDPPEFNNSLKQTRFADFHGHGWLFRAVFKRDRKGNLLDDAGNVVKDPTAEQLTEAVELHRPRDHRASGPRTPEAMQSEMEKRAGLPVHLKDIHLERGMQCIDCHFKQDNHGDGKLYGEPRNAIEIACVDCHGTVTSYANVVTSGPGARELPGPKPGTTQKGRDLLSGLELARTPFGTERFVKQGNVLTQRSMVTPGLSWEVPQIRDSVTEGIAALQSTRDDGKAGEEARPRRGGHRSREGPQEKADLAHADANMTCQSCHSAWITSCFGCHLSQTANQKRPMLHNEGIDTRNWTVYNFQVLRDDVYMLGKDGTVDRRQDLAGAIVERRRGQLAGSRTGSGSTTSSRPCRRRATPARRSTRTCRTRCGRTETKTCTDCHVSASGDNNAVMSQLLLLGTNFVNFMGRFVFVATGQGRSRGGRGHRDGRAAGGHRQRACTSSPIPSSTPRTRSDSRELNDRRPSRLVERARRAGARRVRLHRRRQRAASRSSTSRRSTRRASPRRSSARRCRRSARTRT